MPSAHGDALMLEGQADPQPESTRLWSPGWCARSSVLVPPPVVPGRPARNSPCWDGFRALIEQRAVNIIHRDLLTSGGMLETK
jgi:hypothetical protein